MNIGNTLIIDKNKHYLVEKKDVLDPAVKAVKKIALVLAFLKSNKRWITYFWNVTYKEILNAINDFDTLDGISFTLMLMLWSILSYGHWI